MEVSKYTLPCLVACNYECAQRESCVWCVYIVLCVHCRRDINHLYQLLAYARKIFHQIETIDPVNVDAGTL